MEANVTSPLILEMAEINRCEDWFYERDHENDSKHYRGRKPSRNAVFGLGRMKDSSHKTKPGSRQFTIRHSSEFAKPDSVIIEVEVINHHEHAGKRKDYTAKEQQTATRWTDNSFS